VSLNPQKVCVRSDFFTETVLYICISHLTNWGNVSALSFQNKKHLKNVGPIRHNEPPHANSPDVASGTVARRLRIDVHDDNDNT